MKAVELVVSQEGVVDDFTDNRSQLAPSDQSLTKECGRKDRVRGLTIALVYAFFCARQHHFHNHPKSLGWVPGKLQIGQAHAVDDHLVGADIVRRFEAFRAAIGNEIVLIDTIATHT